MLWRTNCKKNDHTQLYLVQNKFKLQYLVFLVCMLELITKFLKIKIIRGISLKYLVNECTLIRVLFRSKTRTILPFSQNGFTAMMPPNKRNG